MSDLNLPDEFRYLEKTVKDPRSTARKLLQALSNARNDRDTAQKYADIMSEANQLLLEDLDATKSDLDTLKARKEQ